MVPETQLRPAASQAHASRAWLRVLLIGVLLYILGVVILVLTSNPNLFPTVLLLGNFLVPVAYVAFFYQRRAHGGATLPDVALSFVCGGVLGTFSAGVL